MRTFPGFLLLGIATVVLSLSGCNDNGALPSEILRFPLNTGSYWIYSIVDIDSSGNPLAGTEKIDSAVVKGSTILDDQEATQIEHYMQDTSWIEYVRATADQYMALVDLGEDLLMRLDMPLTLWVTIADYAQSQWTVFDTTLQDFKVPLSQLDTVTLSGTIQITGQRLRTENLMIAGTSYNATVFEIRRIIDLQAQFSLNGFPVTGTIALQAPILFWFVDGIGLVRRESATTTLTLQTPMATLPLGTIQGSRSTLLRYAIMQQ